MGRPVYYHTFKRLLESSLKDAKPSDSGNGFYMKINGSRDVQYLQQLGVIGDKTRLSSERYEKGRINTYPVNAERARYCLGVLESLCSLLDFKRIALTSKNFRKKA